jgi:hypothetical protein
MTTTPQISTAALIEIGGREWILGDKHRVYLNNLEDLFGLECEFYKTGNIWRAKLDGEVISNTRASDIASALGFGKLWFDVTEGEFHHSLRDCHNFTADAMFGYLVDEIHSRVSAP